VTIETPIELLEAQRRIKAAQTQKAEAPTETLDDAIKKLGGVLGRIRTIPNAVADNRERAEVAEKLREGWNAPKRHVERVEFDADCLEWKTRLSALSEKIGRGFTVALVGTRGPGKTQMAVELMKQATNSGRSAYYCTAMDYFMRVKDAFHTDRKERQEDAQKFFARFKLLVIDEMNVRSDSAWESNMLSDLIGKRYNAVLDTVLISNETADQFEKSMGPSIIDRLNETGGIVECTWKSFRA
jgi:DNA replication protein DnaC